MKINEYNYNPEAHWDIERFNYNNSIKEMSETQHRTISMLAYYRRSFSYNIDRFQSDNKTARRIYSAFFLKSLPIMLRTSNLPALDLNNRFTETPDCSGIIEDVDRYLRYIDRKFGTWYAPCAA